MATLLYRLGRLAYRRWPLFLVAWLVVLAGIGGFASANSKPMSDTFTIPGIASLKAADVQKDLFPDQNAADKQVGGQVVIAAPEGKTLADEPYRSQVDTLVAALQKMPQLQKDTKLANPVVSAPLVAKQLEQAAIKSGISAEQAKQNAQYLSDLSVDKRIGVISWNFAVTNQVDVKAATQDYVNNAVDAAAKNGLTAVAGGQGMEKNSFGGGASEGIGVLVALVVLVLTFGSLVAAGMPIVNAIVGVALGSVAVSASTAFFTVPSTATALSSMLGLAVGIDYSLFILSRYRAELKHTTDRAHAMGRAIGTAGSAVVFAGTTVVIALVAFSVLGIPALTAMGLAAAATVIFAVLVSLTLLPAIMGILKSKAFAGRVRKDAAADEEDHELVNGSVTLARTIRRRPWIFAVGVVVVLGALAVPVASLHLGLPSDATAKKGTAARTSADLLAEGFGPGKNAPMLVIVDARHVDTATQRSQAFRDVADWALKYKGVANAQVVQTNAAGTGATVLITPTTGPASTKTDDLLSRLRDGQSALEKRTGADVGITGVTAIQDDVSTKLNNALVPYLIIVVGLAFLLLVVVFRSLVVPLLATVGFVLSVLAALGITIRLVQDGWFGLFDPQPIMSFMPSLMIGIVFGLAMDYQVFLTTRMREAYVHGMSARDAVVEGFRHSGRVVTAAALIMTSVFAAFALQDNALIQSIAVAMASAIILDAFLVRMILLPAVMLAIGDKAWWIPKWLDKVLPRVDVEGEGLRAVAAQNPPEPERELVNA